MSSKYSNFIANDRNSTKKKDNCENECLKVIDTKTKRLEFWFYFSIFISRFKLNFTKKTRIVIVCNFIMASLLIWFGVIAMIRLPDQISLTEKRSGNRCMPEDDISEDNSIKKHMRLRSFPAGWHVSMNHPEKTVKHE